jgi:cytochrome c oxidase subunit 2
MLAPGLFVWAQFVNVPANADLVEVVGQQWHWSFRLPGKDGQLGRTTTELISRDNPFGIDPKDPLGQDDRLVNSNELHLPLNRAVKILLRSKDVLHNFAVPQFRVKMDLVPGSSSYLWLTPTRLGRFEILCLELCGMAHYTMRGHVVVDNESDYQQWLRQIPTFQQLINKPTADFSAGQQLYSVCAACHGSDAQGNKATNAPQLAGQGAWYLKRQLRYFRDHIRGYLATDSYGQQMQPFAQALATDAAIDDVTTYIEALPTQPAQAGITGDLLAGKKLYHNCAFCHGVFAQGNYAQNAPKLAGQFDWYLKRQLQHYQQNIRGRHPQDLYGSQMILMSKLLQNEQAIDDVVAYIATLEPNK